MGSNAIEQRALGRRCGLDDGFHKRFERRPEPLGSMIVTLWSSVISQLMPPSFARSSSGLYGTIYAQLNAEIREITHEIEREHRHDGRVPSDHGRSDIQPVPEQGRCRKPRPSSE